MRDIEYSNYNTLCDMSSPFDEVLVLPACLFLYPSPVPLVPSRMPAPEELLTKYLPNRLWSEVHLSAVTSFITIIMSNSRDRTNVFSSPYVPFWKGLMHQASRVFCAV